MAPWVCDSWHTKGKHKTVRCGVENFGWRTTCRCCGEFRTKTAKEASQSPPWHNSKVVGNGAAPKFNDVKAQAAKLGKVLVDKETRGKDAKHPAAVTSADAKHRKPKQVDAPCTACKVNHNGLLA